MKAKLVKSRALAPERPLSRAADRRISIPDNLRVIIARQPFFKGLTPRQIQLLADSAMVEEFAAGETLVKEGDPANRFYLILEGKVQVESPTAQQRRVSAQILGPGDDLGWSWLFPPYYMLFTARAVEKTKVIFFYATPLRERCDVDPVFGYEIMKRIAGAMMEYLRA
jgi:CRP-like cAMP-binding protein